MSSGDIKEYYFIRSGRTVRRRQFCWISGIAQFEKLRAFDHTAGVYIQTRDNSLREHLIRALFLWAHCARARTPVPPDTKFL